MFHSEKNEHTPVAVLLLHRSPEAVNDEMEILESPGSIRCPFFSLDPFSFFKRIQTDLERLALPLQFCFALMLAACHATPKLNTVLRRKSYGVQSGNKSLSVKSHLICYDFLSKQWVHLNKSFVLVTTRNDVDACSGHRFLHCQFWFRCLLIFTCSRRDRRFRCDDVLALLIFP